MDPKDPVGFEPTTSVLEGQALELLTHLYNAPTSIWTKDSGLQSQGYNQT